MLVIKGLASDYICVKSLCIAQYYSNLVPSGHKQEGLLWAYDNAVVLMNKKVLDC